MSRNQMGKVLAPVDLRLKEIETARKRGGWAWIQKSLGEGLERW